MMVDIYEEPHEILIELPKMRGSCHQSVTDSHREVWPYTTRLPGSSAV